MNLYSILNYKFKGSHSYRKWRCFKLFVH